MAIDRKALDRRVTELTELARSSGFNNVDHELDRLPDGDVAARLGLLASLLGIELGLAFDAGVDPSRRA